MQKINNIVAMQEWPVGGLITIKNGDSHEPTMQELTMVAVGPCVVIITPKAERRKDAPTYVLGVFEGRETFQFAFPGEEYYLSVEPSGPVYYASPLGAVAVDVGEVPFFTRMEKPGLYMDELSFALHQQSVLTRIAASRERMEADAYQRDLEGQLDSLRATVEGLTAARQEAQDEAAKAAEQAAREAAN